MRTVVSTRESPEEIDDEGDSFGGRKYATIRRREGDLDPEFEVYGNIEPGDLCICALRCSHSILLRRDGARGFVHVGWAEKLPWEGGDRELYVQEERALSLEN